MKTNFHFHVSAITIIASLLTFSASAADLHVRSGATGSGNGTDWANAWTSLSQINWPSVNPGDTIYVAAGIYGAFSVGKSGSSGKPITIKRATAGSHGSAGGWNVAYDGLVTIDGNATNTWSRAVDLGTSDYITIDGAIRYGIKIVGGGFGIGSSDGDYLTLRYLDIGSSDSGKKMGEDAIQGRGNNLVVEYSYIHDNDNIETHGDGIQWFAGNNITIRYNVFKNNGQHLMLTETVWGNDYINDLNMYYNVFYNRGGAHYNGISKKLCPQSGRYWRVYNNTFDLEAKSNSGFDNIFSGAGSCGAMDFRNNAVIYSNASSLGTVSHSYNGYDNSGQHAVYNIPSETGQVTAADLGFVNADAADYRLTSSSPLIGKGTNVGLTQDFDGKAVPSSPSIGAFEGASTSGGELPVPTDTRVIP